MNKIKENQNQKILETLFYTVMRTMDYVTVKNEDKSLFTCLTSDSQSQADNVKLLEDVVTSIISKQIRNKFSI